VELAKQLAPAFALIQAAAFKVVSKNNVTSREGRKMLQLRKHIDAARSALDSAYHAVTSNEEFMKAGHVYYSADTTK
jgi:hypothetical protein